MTAEWDDLARLAETYPPRERTWHVHEMHKVFVGSGDPRSLSTIVHMSGDDLADLTEEAAWEARRDAAWIAAANPATILRLIAEVRDLSERLAQAYRDEVLAHDERAQLAARLAAVEALADEWERQAGPDSRAHDVYGRQVVTVEHAVASLRAALAAPTDTTKEN